MCEMESSLKLLKPQFKMLSIDYSGQVSKNKIFFLVPNLLSKDTRRQPAMTVEVHTWSLATSKPSSMSDANLLAKSFKSIQKSIVQKKERIENEFFARKT